MSSVVLHTSYNSSPLPQSHPCRISHFLVPALHSLNLSEICLIGLLWVAPLGVEAGQDGGDLGWMSGRPWWPG